MNAARVESFNDLALTRTAYYKIRRQIRDLSGFFGELAAAEVLDNAIKHGKRPRAALAVYEAEVKLVVKNHNRLRIVDDYDAGGYGLVMLRVLKAQGLALSFNHHVDANVHIVTLTMRRTDTAR